MLAPTLKRQRQLIEVDHDLLIQSLIDVLRQSRVSIAA
jgi:hypothetical protein